MTAQELLIQAKPHITRYTRCGVVGFQERTDLFEALSIVGAGRPDVVIDALRLLKLVTGTTDLPKWQKHKSELEIRQAFDRAAEMQ